MTSTRRPDAAAPVAGATATGRVPALDGVRGLAALMVLCCHVGFVTGRSLQSDLLAPILSRGNFGVTVFFLLSGFLLYRPFVCHSFGVGPQQGVRTFWWRRAVRIFPALWIAVAVTLAVITPRKVPLSDWPSYLLLVQTYNHHDNDADLTQLWSLAVEVAFYAVLPLLAFLVGGPGSGPERALRRQVALLCALVVISMGYNVTISSGLITNTQAALWLPDYLDWFAGGMALAVLAAVPPGIHAFARTRATLQTWASARGTCWLIAGVLFAITLTPIGTPRSLVLGTYWQWTMQHYLFLGAACFLLLPFVLGQGGRTGAVLGSRFGALVGSLSYAIYLWHPALMQWLQRRLDIPVFSGWFVQLLLATLAATTAVAALSWYLVERPLLRRYTSSSGTRRRRTTPASTPAVSAATQSS